MKELFASLNTSNPFATPYVVDTLNYRIEQEEQSSRLYHAMSMWLNDNGYFGAAKEWQKYSEEELSHAKWAKDYLLALGVQPAIPALPKPTQVFTGLLDVVRKSHKHEILITQQCNDMAKTSLKNGDFLLHQLALKYLSEQVEEMEKLQDLIDRLQIAGEDKAAILLIDKEL